MNGGDDPTRPEAGFGGHAAALWTCDEYGRLMAMNDAGEKLLGCSFEDLSGKHWSTFLAGRDECGRAVFQGEECPLSERILTGKDLGKWRIQLSVGEHAGRWIEILPIPCAPGPRTSTMLFYGRSLGAEDRMQNYVRRIAMRSGDLTNCDWKLTPREIQVLDLLAMDLDSHAVARIFSLSYSTVRNHVRNIIEKMRTHSIQESIARYLMADALEHSA